MRGLEPSQRRARRTRALLLVLHWRLSSATKCLMLWGCLLLVDWTKARFYLGPKGSFLWNHIKYVNLPDYFGKHFTEIMQHLNARNIKMFLAPATSTWHSYNPVHVFTELLGICLQTWICAAVSCLMLYLSGTVSAWGEFGTLLLKTLNGERSRP